MGSRVVSGHTATIGAPPVVANGILYVSFAYNGLRALNAKTGEVLWWFGDLNYANKPISASPLVIIAD